MQFDDLKVEVERLLAASAAPKMTNPPTRGQR
jgi:hypothetical protein